MDKIPGQVGYLILNEDGAVVSSHGDLENDEKTADIIMNLVGLTTQIDKAAFGPDEGFKRISLTYDDYGFVICLSNRKIHIVKRVFKPTTEAISISA